MARTRKRKQDDTPDPETSAPPPEPPQGPEPAHQGLHLSRREMGVPGPRRAPQRLQSSEGVVVHCTAGSRPRSPADVPDVMRRIYRAHTSPEPRGRGWTDWGYHWAVDPWGGVWRLCGWGVVGRHARTSGRSLNLRSHGLVVLGNGKAMTEAEHAALLWLIEEHDRQYGQGFVLGHRDVSRKACPGDEVYDRVVKALGRPAAG